MGLITQITALVQRIALSVRDLRDRSALLDTAAVRFGARNDGARQSFPSGQWSRLSTALNDVYLPHPAYDAAQGRFVAPVDGVYCLGALSTFSMSNGKKLITALYVNGRRFVLLGRGTAGASDYTGFGVVLWCPYRRATGRRSTFTKTAATVTGPLAVPATIIFGVI